MNSPQDFPTSGGWQFRQPQTGWVNPMALVGRDASVKAIRDHRLKNPAITAKHQLSTDPGAITNELIAFQVARGALSPAQNPTPAPTFFQPGRNNTLPVRVVAAAANIKTAAQGTAVILDWFKSGGDPVAQELAEKRAEVCVSCPRNVEGAWYTTGPAHLLRAAIKEWQALKGSNFAFETKQGDKLKSCDICKCLMGLKAFVPLLHIVDHTKPEIMAQFPEHCWIVKRDQ